MIEFRQGSVIFAEEFPRAASRCEVWEIGVAVEGVTVWWTSEEQGLGVGIGALSEEDLGDGGTVEAGVFRTGGMGEGEEGWGEVDGGEDGVCVDGVFFVFGDEAGAPGDEGRADASLVELGFESAEVSRLAGALFGAVIGAEQDQGIVPQGG